MAATTAIITGSGRGIGRETAMMLAKKGVNVVVCSRTQREIDETVRDIKKFHARVVGVKCDVGVASDVDMLVGKTVKEFGDIDILVCNTEVPFSFTSFMNLDEGSSIILRLSGAVLLE